jgi:hypothetical protein
MSSKYGKLTERDVASKSVIHLFNWKTIDTFNTRAPTEINERIGLRMELEKQMQSNKIGNPCEIAQWQFDAYSLELECVNHYYE